MPEPPFSINTAVTLVSLSVEAYKPVLEYDVEQFGFTMNKVLNDKETGTQGFICSNNDEIVAFLLGWLV